MDSKTSITVKVFYKKDGIDGEHIFRQCILLWIEKEVQDLCKKKS